MGLQPKFALKDTVEILMRGENMSGQMFSLDGLKALVTGSATGLGQAIAVMLARQGADVMVTDRTGVGLDETKEKAAEYGNKVYGTGIDIRDPEQVKEGVKSAVFNHGRDRYSCQQCGNKPACGWAERYGRGMG